MAAQAQKPQDFASIPESLLAGWRGTGRTLWLPVRGISMWPLLREGDEIRVEFRPENEARVGDIALLAVPGARVAHRLIGRARDGRWIEKGDFNPQAFLVQPGEWLGTVIQRRRGGRERPLGRGRFFSRLLLWQSRFRLLLFRRQPRERA